MFRSLRKLIVQLSWVSLVFSPLVLGSKVALATDTPEVCPSSFSAKYGCTKVSYSPTASNATIYVRWFKGSTGAGGATEWRINWAKDWEIPNGSVVFKEIFGPGSWRTDSFYSPYFGIGPTRTRIRNSVVTFQFKYHTADASGNFYWCSWIHQHYMQANASNVIDAQPCTDY